MDWRTADVMVSGESSDNLDEGAGERAVLLATKLHVPGVRHHLIQRTALLDALSLGASQKVALISAPAGWGKTTLLAQQIASASKDRRYGWLSLDPADNDPVRFWTYVISALQTAVPGVGSRALEFLSMGADPVRTVLPILLN